MQPSKGDSYIPVTRCSTEEQSQDGFSHEYQIAGIRGSAIVRKFDLREVAHFQDTVTGTRFDNRGEGLEAAYRFCDRNRGTVKYLFVQRWDRLGRDVLGCLQAIQRFRLVGVEVNCPEKWMDFEDSNHIILLSLEFAIAQGESMKISERTRNGMYAALEAGFWPSRTPVGYMPGETAYLGKTRKLFTPHPEKAQIIRECFEQHAAGEGKVELFKKYGPALGIARSHFCRIFQNVFYRGDVYVKAFKGNPARIIRGQHEAIVDRALWDRCQQVQEEAAHGATGKTWYTTTKGGDRDYYLKGLLRDAATGAPFTAYASKSKSGRYHHYYAIASRGGQIIALQRAHGLVDAALRGFVLNPEVSERIRTEAERQMNEQVGRANREIQQADAGIRRAQERIENVTNAFADGQITPEEYRKMKSKFERDLLESDQKKESAMLRCKNIDDTVLKVLQLLTQVDTVFAASTGEYKKKMLRAMFPEGFSIDVKNQKVRTPRINSNLSAIYSFPIGNECLEILDCGVFPENPAVGGEVDQVRTLKNGVVTEDIIMKDRDLLIRLFAA